MSLTVDKLSLAIGGKPILRSVSLAVDPGEVLGVVGESGSGKSLTALAAMQLLPNGSRATGSIKLAGTELLTATETRMQTLRGDDIAMIFQEPMTALNPVHTIGAQVAEGIRLHRRIGASEAMDAAADQLKRVGLDHIPLARYPHELSGGQRQRVMIAMACACEPKVLIADEPTTALDVTLQAQIMVLLRNLVDETGMALLLISHDLAVVAEQSDRIVVMHEGRVVDSGTVSGVLSNITHPYTQQLADASAHKPTRTAFGETAPPLLTATTLVRDYATPRENLFRAGTPFRAVDGVSLTIHQGESVGLVGESGCGKSTLARMVLGLNRPTSGTITFDGTAVTGSTLPLVRRRMQPVFQDPFASFDPRHKVLRLVTEPLFLEGAITPHERRNRAVDALREVGIDADALDRYPHEFSGGQRQRIAIARALITRPDLIVADEPVSALDVSIRARILDLLADLQSRLGVAMLFISHDLGVVSAICDTVLVMDAGTIVERGPVGTVLANPTSQAARQLVSATPDLSRALANRQDRA